MPLKVATKNLALVAGCHQNLVVSGDWLQDGFLKLVGNQQKKPLLTATFYL
jgi:hypothetical protein